MEQKFHLKITSAVVIDGKIQKPETIVHLPSRVAVNLLERGKAMLATAEDMAAAAAEPEALVAEDAARELVGLYGSSILPALIEIDGKEVQLGTVVAAAHEASGMTAEDWNAMPEADREKLLADQVEAMKAAAATTKATTPPAAKKAARNAK